MRKTLSAIAVTLLGVFSVITANAADITVKNAVGEQVVPLEQEITKTATKNFPRFQQAYAPLAEKLSGYGLGGNERVRALNQEITDLLAAALLRLRARPSRDAVENSERVHLGFPGQQRVNANPDHDNGVRP